MTITDTHEIQEPEEHETIAVVVLTHNRVHLLRQCVENVISVASPATRQIVIWNNASTDGTQDYLDGLEDPRITVVHHASNIGQNAYAPAFEMTSAEYLVELDDDVVGAPANWDTILRDALRRLPTIGFLAADLEDDPHDVTSHHRYRVRPDEYTPYELNGVRLLTGPAGGTCAMTPADVYRRVGGFQKHHGKVFFLEDAAYGEDIRAIGYEPAVLADLKVHHTGGPYYAEMPPEKAAYWADWERANARKAAVKRVLLRLPFVRRLNARHGWFVEP